MFTQYTRIENIRTIKFHVTIYNKLHCENQSHNFHSVDWLVRELKITTKIHFAMVFRIYSFVAQQNYFTISFIRAKNKKSFIVKCVLDSIS